MSWNIALEYFETVQNVFGTLRSANTQENRNGFILNACEHVLAKSLRKYCDHEGKETDTEISSTIFHQMGKVYLRRSPDKVCLIKAAALMNAAICRKSSRENEIRQDLARLYQHTLALSGSPLPNIDVEFQSARCGKQLEVMRDEVDRKVKHVIQAEKQVLDFEKVKLRKIFDFECIQEWITKQYVNIMNEIMHYCVKSMGTPPCRYALVAMGSLAKLEITPYSDFENCILLERGVERLPTYEGIIEYFAWVGVFFQFVLVGLKETIVRFLSIPFLNDSSNPVEDWFFDVITPCGVCPDGLDKRASKNPVSNEAKLIRSVGEMLKYVDPRFKAMKDPRLADMLTRTSFVSGYADVHDDFDSEVKKIDVRDDIHQHKVKNLEECLRNFSTSKKLVYVQSNKEIDIKRLVFRGPTMFAGALGRCHNVYEASTFEVVKGLRAQNIISEQFETDFLFAIAMACEVRLLVYGKWRSHKDRIKSRPSWNISESNLRNLMGERVSLAFFQIACEIQNLGFHLLSPANNEQLDDQDLDKKLNKVRVYYALSLHDKALELCHDFGWDNVEQQSPPQCLYQVALCFFDKKLYKKALRFFLLSKDGLETCSKPPHLDLIDCLLHVMICYKEVGDMRKSLEYLSSTMKYESYLGVPRNVPVSVGSLKDFSGFSVDKHQETHYAVATRLHWVGKFQAAFNPLSETALSCYRRELALRKRLSANPNNTKVAKCYFCIGQSLVARDKNTDALEALMNAKRTYELCRENVDRKLCKVENVLGAAYLALGNNDSSLQHFEEESRLRFEIPEEVDLDKAAACFFNIGCLHNYGKRTTSALLYLNTTVDILDSLSLTPKRNMLLRACKAIIMQVTMNARFRRLTEN